MRLGNMKRAPTSIPKPIRARTTRIKAAQSTGKRAISPDFFAWMFPKMVKGTKRMTGHTTFMMRFLVSCQSYVQ